MPKVAYDKSCLRQKPSMPKAAYVKACLSQKSSMPKVAYVKVCLSQSLSKPRSSQHYYTNQDQGWHYPKGASKIPIQIVQAATSIVIARWHPPGRGGRWEFFGVPEYKAPLSFYPPPTLHRLHALQHQPIFRQLFT